MDSRRSGLGLITNRLVVRADWLFTSTTIVIQPLTSFAMMKMGNLPFESLWLTFSVWLYLLAGACWLPAVWLQIRMARMAEDAHRTGKALPRAYARLARAWVGLGIPAFAVIVAITSLMVFKPA